MAAEDIAWLGGITLRLAMLLLLVDVNGHAIRHSVLMVWQTRIKAAGR
jgi:hypothetical protein